VKHGVSVIDAFRSRLCPHARNAGRAGIEYTCW